jgi:hypothetical protein
MFPSCFQRANFPRGSRGSWLPIEKNDFGKRQQLTSDLLKTLMFLTFRLPGVGKFAMPPDTAAAKLWLTNRRSDKWRDKQISEQENAEPIQVTVDIADNN